MRASILVLFTSLYFVACQQASGPNGPSIQSIAPDVVFDYDNATHTRLVMSGLAEPVQIDVQYARSKQETDTSTKNLHERFLISMRQTEPFEIEIILTEDNVLIKESSSLNSEMFAPKLQPKVEAFDTRFNDFSRYLEKLHRFETARCRGSRFWAQVSESPPGKRGDFLLAVGNSLSSKRFGQDFLLRISPQGKIVGITVVRGLVINSNPLRVTYVALSNFPAISHGRSGVASWHFSNFSNRCAEQYRKLFPGAGFTDRWLPLYSDPQIDELASRLLDKRYASESAVGFHDSEAGDYQSFDIEALNDWRTEFPFVANPSIQTPKFE